MARLRYYSSTGVRRLNNAIEANLEWYFDPSGALPSVALSEVREARLDMPNFPSIEVGTATPSSSDGENALRVYVALRALNLRQASDERLWVYLCHNVDPQYVAQRWLGKRPESDEEAITRVRNHFFVRNNRATVRDNGLSRLWWLGKIATEVDTSDPKGFLTILLHRQDVRSALIERPSVSTNVRVLRAIYATMRKHWEGDRRLFEREIFRGWMRGLNRKGGVILLDALPDRTLSDLVNEQAAEALTS